MTVGELVNYLEYLIAGKVVRLDSDVAIDVKEKELGPLTTKHFIVEPFIDKSVMLWLTVPKEK